MNRNPLAPLLARVIQLANPRPFRITWRGPWAPTGRLAALLPLQAHPPHSKPSALSDSPQANVWPDSNLLALANVVFRMKQNLRSLGSDTKETRSLKRSLQRIEDLLESCQVGVLDLTGHPYHGNRRDFEPVSPPETRPELARPTIVLCETPCVMIRGRLAQAAKGLYAAPPLTPNTTPPAS